MSSCNYNNGVTVIKRPVEKCAAVEPRDKGGLGNGAMVINNYSTGNNSQSPK